MQHRFAVMKLRLTLHEVKNRCVRCQKRKAERVNPMMSVLPLERLGYRKPTFCYCGVDFFGPFYVSVRRSSEKRLGFLFTCMAIRSSWVLRGSLPAKELRLSSGWIMAQTSWVPRSN